MQNKKKGKAIKKDKKNKHSSKPKKFSKNQPAAKRPDDTEQQKKITTNTNKITKAINKNIEKTMMERAVNSKEQFKFLK